MKTKSELDKWAAEKCGVRVVSTSLNHFGDPYFEYDNGGDGSTVIESEWTLSDARCRAVFWEWFVMNKKGYTKMTRSDLDAYIVSVQKGTDITTSLNGYKKTLDAADIECIQAIKDAEGG